MGIEKVEERMVVAEIKLEEHGARIGKLEDKVISIHADLSDLKRILTNIKYWLMGIGTFYVAQEVGLNAIVKKLLGF